MSLSRAEVEAMDPDELVEALVGLSATVDDLKTLVHTSIEKRKALEDRVEELEAENARLRDQLEDVDRVADQAMTVASRGHDPDSRSKTAVAKHLTRNELVRRCATGGAAQDRPVTISKVQEMANPEHELAWAIVDRAWSKLREEWPAFRETMKDGQKALTLKPSDVSESLARTVERDLGRDDLAKRFVGENGGARP